MACTPYRIKQLTKRARKRRLVTEHNVEALLSSLQKRRCLKTVKWWLTLHQPRHALQHPQPNGVHEESAFRTGPTAVKIVMCGQFKTEAAI